MTVKEEIPIDAQIIYDIEFTSDIVKSHSQVVERAIVFTNKCVEPTGLTVTAIATTEIAISSTDISTIQFPVLSWSPAEFSQTLCGSVSVTITETTSGSTTFESQLGILPFVDSESDPTSISIPAPNSWITGGLYTFDVTVIDTLNGITDTT